MVLKKTAWRAGVKNKVKIIVWHCVRISSPGFPQMFLISHFSLQLVSYTQMCFPHLEAHSEKAKSFDIIIIFTQGANIILHIMQSHSPNLTQTLLFRKEDRNVPCTYKHGVYSTKEFSKENNAFVEMAFCLHYTSICQYKWRFIKI